MKNVAPNCKVGTVLTSFPALTADVHSGRDTGGIMTYSEAAPAAASGQVNLLNDPLHVTPATAGVHPGSYPALVAFGLSDQVKSHKTAVAAFVKSLSEAIPLVKQMTPEQLADMTLQHDKKLFAGFAKDSLIAAWKSYKTEMPKSVAINDTEWKQFLNQIPDYHVAGVSKNDPRLAYGAAVDNHLS